MNYYIKELNLEDVSSLILENNLNIKDKTDYTIGVFDKNKLVATGSLYKNVIKLIAVEKNYRGQNLLATIITALIKELTKRNMHKYFIYTNKENAHLFSDLGFYLIAQTDNVAFFENSTFTITEKLKKIKENISLQKGSVAALVMNCNPVTKGHLYLIEIASRENDNVIVFLVEENKSFFPFDIRFDLTKRATKHLKNVFVVPSTEYIISSSTFPNYFIKDLSKAAIIQMELDAVLFKNHFVNTFNISKRYVGTEPLDAFTSNYNEVLKKVLNNKLITVERLKIGNNFVSASLVRAYLKDDKYELIKDLVPKTTFDYLMTLKGKK